MTATMTIGPILKRQKKKKIGKIFLKIHILDNVYNKDHLRINRQLIGKRNFNKPNCLKD